LRVRERLTETGPALPVAVGRCHAMAAAVVG